MLFGNPIRIARYVTTGDVVKINRRKLVVRGKLTLSDGSNQFILHDIQTNDPVMTMRVAANHPFTIARKK